MRRSSLLGLVCASLAVGAGEANANIINWGNNGYNYNTWADARNWVGGVLPTAGDTAVIASGTPNINATLSPAPDVIRVDPGGTASFASTITNNFVLNGGLFTVGGSGGTVNGTVQLTADSTIRNTLGNSNRSLTFTGAISEDGTPRKLIFDGKPHTATGNTNDNIKISGTNTCSGGSDVYGPTVTASASGALGTGPVNILGGILYLKAAGTYTHGTVTVSAGTLKLASGVTNGIWQLQGGTLTGDATTGIGATNQVTITNTGNILAGANPFNINTSIGGTGKAVLNDNGTTGNTKVLQINVLQNWTGGTDVKGPVSLPAGGRLPAGTVTVYPVSPAPGTGMLQLKTASSLSTGTDLVLLYDWITNKFGTIQMSANQTVHSLTLNGQVVPAGVYTQADFPDYIIASGTNTLTVQTPDTAPSAITNLADSNRQLASIRLTWSAPVDIQDPGHAATGYDVRYSVDPITDPNFPSATVVPQSLVPQAPGTLEALVVTDLTPGTTYYFAIKSVDSAGNWSDLSNVLMSHTITPGQAPPAAVVDLHAINVARHQLTLAWTAPADPDNPSAASYDIRMSQAPIDEGNFASAMVMPQGLVPQLPGTAENLLVTGLTPGTTYYFALKAADETPNWSGISNVLVQATVAPDVTPPAPVSDLAAGGTDPFSTRLTWTAPADPDDPSPASYEIRMSTAPIDEGNWASAAVVRNPPAPQLAGSAESLVVRDLVPGTTYHFAVKATDAEGNTSGLSNLASFTTASLPVMPVVTSLTIAEEAGVTTIDYPVTLSMVFARGDVADSVVVRANGVPLATQTDVKVRWPDDSVRHALVSFLLPSLAANSQVTIEFLAGGPNYNTGWMTRDQLLASDFEALMAFSVLGEPTNVSARQLVQNMPQVQYWMKGSIVTEFIIRDWNTNVAGQLNVSYRVRVYPTAGHIRVSTVVDNTWINAMGNITYNCALSLGLSSPQVVFSKLGLTQWQSSRWHKVFWQGTTPPKIAIRYDLPYMVRTGAVPKYDPNLVVPGSAITDEYSRWSASAHDIMDSGRLTTYMPTTGGRPEINPYPRWASMYLCSMDSRMAEMTINYGDLSGSVPLHFRESDANRSFYGHPVAVDDRPTIWILGESYRIEQYVDPADRFPPPIGEMTTSWTVDLAHQGSLAYIPYLITGDLYYLEEMHFWAHCDLGASDPNRRGGTQCWLVDQVRGNAWAFRNVVDAAAMTPADMPEKAYLEAKITNNINKWNSDCIANGLLFGMSGTVRGFGISTPIDETSQDPATCSARMSSWQNDYMTWSLTHAFQMGYPTLDLVHWLGKSLVDRFGDWPGWNRYRGTDYVYPAKGFDASGNPAFFPTWADVNNAFLDKVGPSSFNGAYAGDYNFTARGAMALLTNLPNGLANWTWLDTALAPWRDGLASEPAWAFVPQYRAADANNDGQVDVVDLLYLVDTFGLTFGQAGYNPAGDFNGDFSVDVVDLLILVENFGL